MQPLSEGPRGGKEAGWEREIKMANPDHMANGRSHQRLLRVGMRPRRRLRVVAAERNDTEVVLLALRRGVPGVSDELELALGPTPGGF